MRWFSNLALNQVDMGFCLVPLGPPDWAECETELLSSYNRGLSSSLWELWSWVAFQGGPRLGHRGWTFHLRLSSHHLCAIPGEEGRSGQG